MDAQSPDRLTGDPERQFLSIPKFNSILIATSFFGLSPARPAHGLDVIYRLQNRIQTENWNLLFSQLVSC